MWFFCRPFIPKESRQQKSGKQLSSAGKDFRLVKYTSSATTQISHELSIAGQLKYNQGFPGGAVVENLPANAGDTGSSPGLGRSQVLRSN